MGLGSEYVGAPRGRGVSGGVPGQGGQMDKPVIHGEGTGLAQGEASLEWQGQNMKVGKGQRSQRKAKVQGSLG